MGVYVDDTNERILRSLVAAGMTTKQIGKAIGKSTTWVKYALPLCNLETARARAYRLAREQRAAKETT